MRIETRRDTMLIIPESDQDRAFIEDTLGMKGCESTISFSRLCDVAMGYHKPDSYVLKASPIVPPPVSSAQSTPSTP